MSILKPIKDYSEEVKEKIPEYVDPVKNDKTQLAGALVKLLALEKKARLAADAESTKKLAVAIITLCKDCESWKILNDHITLLCKRRAQLRKVIQATIQESVKFIELTPDKKTKVALIETLRTVSSGKMFVELERARMTKTLAEMKEEEGDVTEAANILQEVQVETIGSMEAREKAAFLLEQVRLCSAKKDFVRAEIISKKVNTKKINAPDFADLKMKYYELMVELHKGNGSYLEIAKAYQEMFNTKTVQDDEKQWKPILEKAVIFLLLSPFDAEVSDMLHRFKAEPKMAQMPSCQSALDEFTLKELMGWPLKHEAEWEKVDVFEGEEGEQRWKDLKKMIMQHNIRVIADYYGRITAKRLSGLLTLDEDSTEKLLSEMVSSKQLFAKIDRPTGIITFDKAKKPNELINAWAEDISSLLSLVDKTCHLIHKENMLHKIK